MKILFYIFCLCTLIYADFGINKLESIIYENKCSFQFQLDITHNFIIPSKCLVSNNGIYLNQLDCFEDDHVICMDKENLKNYIINTEYSKNDNKITFHSFYLDIQELSYVDK